MKKVLLIILFFITSFIFAQSWELDQSFTSANGGDFGYAIDLSDDGMILAVGNYTDDTVDNNAGKVQVFKKTTTGWLQIGSDLFGASSSDYFGKSVSLSSDGQILAVGISGSDGNGLFSGEVKVYQYNGNDWEQLGNSIYGDSWDFVGDKISLNDDGSVLALSSATNDDNGDNAGVVRIYKFNGSSWNLKGSEVYGTADNDYFGGSLAINAAGDTFIAGPSMNGTRNVGAKIFTFNNDWEQIGSNLIGNNLVDDLSGYPVAINDSGEKVAFSTLDNNNYYKNIQVFKNINGNWEQEGDALTGGSQSSFGTSIAFNNNGDRIAIGASGYVKVFDWDGNAFVQVGETIIPEQSNDYFGYAISISDDGKTIAIGGGGNYVAIYKFLNLPLITVQPQPKSNICIGSDVSFSVTATNSNSYQWQVSSDNGNSWTNIIDDATYSESDTNELKINVVANLDNNQYRCVLTNSDGSVLTNEVLLKLDNEVPVINTVFSDVNLDADWQCEATLLDYTTNIDASDNCTALNDLVITQTPAPGTKLTGETNIITISVADEMGNISQTTFNIAVVDHSAPVISSSLNDDYIDAVYNCAVALPDYTTGVVVADNCSNNIEIEQSPVPGTLISGDSNIVTITVTDESGNKHSESFNVAVVDETAPWYDTFSNTQELDANDNCEAILPDYTTQITVHDNCSDLTNITIQQSLLPGTIISGTNNAVEISITDEAGNVTTLNLNISVVDNTPPQINYSPDNQTLNADSRCEGILPDYTNSVDAIDNCTSESSLIITQNPLAGSVISGDFNKVTISVSDEKGNISQKDFNVAVVDKTPPVFLSRFEDQVIEATSNCQAPLPDYTININADDNCMFNFMPEQTPEPGTMISGDNNVVTVTIEDEAGNQSTASFNVAVEDTTSPVITYVDNQIVTANDQNGYLVQGKEFDISNMSDNCEIASVVNDFNNQSTLDGALLPMGVTNITWTVMDNKGNEITNNFYVEVVENTTTVSNLIKENISIYPNPFDNKINLNFGELQAQKIILQDLTGKIIKELVVKQQKTTINTKNLHAGIYLLRIISDLDTYTFKLLKK